MSEKVHLSFFQKIVMRINGCVCIGTKKETGWREELQIYAFLCKEHGVVTNYFSGHYMFLQCPDPSHCNIKNSS